MSEKKKREEQVINNLKRKLTDLRESFYSEPTYLFKVGDRVTHGALLKSVVTEVLDGGKIYKLRELCKGERGGPNYERDAYAAWVDLRVPFDVVNPLNPVEDPFIYESDHFRQINYFQQDISSLLGRYYGSYAGVDTEPDYQRELVWDLDDKVALIDSIFQRIDIGKFTFIKKPFAVNQKGYEILDGKQRLSALVEFYEDRFKYRGKTFSQLHPRDRGYFRCFSISIGETNHMTDKEKYEYFLRLNVGGKPQDPNHIRYVKGLLEKA